LQSVAETDQGFPLAAAVTHLPERVSGLPGVSDGFRGPAKPLTACGEVDQRSGMGEPVAAVQAEIRRLRSTRQCLLGLAQVQLRLAHRHENSPLQRRLGSSAEDFQCLLQARH
jgi:hypothetical protein